MSTTTTAMFPTLSNDLLADVNGGDLKGFLDGTGRVLDTMTHDAGVGAAGGGAIGAAAGLVGGPAAPVTVSGGAATGAALGGLGGAVFGMGRGLGTEAARWWNGSPAPAK